MSGLYALYQGQSVSRHSDTHFLVGTDTVVGKACVALVEEHLRHDGYTVIDATPNGLTSANTDTFREGVKRLIHNCANTLPGYREQHYHVSFNLDCERDRLRSYR